MNKTIKNINDKSDNNLKYEIVKFVDNQFVLDVRADKTNETVWLTQKEIAKLFDKSVSTINEHIKKILEDELDEKEVVKKFGKTEFSKKPINLLYFIVKDHPFIDGCKRIAAGLFLFYLSKNALLSINKLTISNGTLTAITLLVAESRPEEKEIMINIIMTILFNKM